MQKKIKTTKKLVIFTVKSKIQKEKNGFLRIPLLVFNIGKNSGGIVILGIYLGFTIKKNKYGKIKL